MSISSSTGFNVKYQSNIVTSNGKTLYVGGSGPGNYTKIQDAIDNASDGDAVFVYNRTYYENLIVNKSINLIGEDRDTTIIDGNQSEVVVYVTANLINISRFTIKNGSYDGINIYNSSQHVIKDNNIRENIRFGISLLLSNKSIIEDNTITNNKQDGIIIYRSKNNIIRNNHISDNKFGIWMTYFSTGNTITGNDIANRIQGIGVDLLSNVTIRGNNIHNNFFGISVYFCKKCIIEKNNFIDNRLHASSSYTWKSKWDENYWDNWIGLKINLPIFQKLPKVIRGGGIIPEIPLLPRKLDWHPASEPYDIEV
jgi:parallel beta-helix repeat protein